MIIDTKWRGVGTMTESATILLVEDDLALLEGIAELLEIADLGYQVQVMKATDGVDALERLADHCPDLIISDIMMPRMDGFEFLQELRKNPQWVHVPVIFLTARGTEQDILEGRLSGAELYITKPYVSDEFLQLVESQLRRAFELQRDRIRKLDVLSHNIVQLLNHEFRTPLTYVTAYYQMLAQGLTTDDSNSLREYLQGIQAGANRLYRLISDLLRVIELRTGETAARYRRQAGPIEDLDQLLQQGCQVQGKANPTVAIDCQIPDRLPAIYGDRESLKEVFDHLLDNAIKFSLLKRQARPHVIVTAGASNGQVYFAVKDNGVGFPEHIQDQLFDVFFQYNREEMEQQGAGTGLAIVQGLVKLHGGQIQVESIEGLGSTFMVRLPAYRSEVGRSMPGRNGSKRQATVLVAEDERYLLEGLRDLLEIIESDYKIKVLTANDGQEALDILSRHEPDLIISDIMMPRMDGYEFLRRVRENAAWVHIPFMFLTAKGEREDILRGRRSGVEEYITKPYDSNELFHLVVTQLDRHFQKQGVLQSSFNELKQGILELLLPDFRLPLVMVADYSTKLSGKLENVQTHADLKAYLQGIQLASQQISHFVADFISLAELRAGEIAGDFSMRARPMDASLVFAETQHVFHYRSQSGRLTVDWQVEQGLPQVLIDPEPLSGALVRLTDLLFDFCYTAECTDIFCRAERDESILRARMGLRNVALPAMIFDQIESVLAQPERAMNALSGYDPALLIAKGVLAVHGGHLSVENSSEAGFAFVITLPLYQPAPTNTSDR